MALTGQLSDLSLAELIEFFCNQRKTGRLKVDYPRAPGVFYMDEGELVDAKLGLLEGEDAVYFALTLPNAAFDFNTNMVPERRTINDAWTHVVLEGLRRFDEGISPGDPYSDDMDLSYAYDPDAEAAAEAAAKEAAKRKKFKIAGAVGAVVLCAVGVVAVPNILKSRTVTQYVTIEKIVEKVVPGQPAASPTPKAPTAQELAEAERKREEARRKREEEEDRKRREALARANNPQPTPKTSVPTPEPPKPANTGGPQMVAVKVEYDENGRVTTAALAGPAPGNFGATALSIARRRRFPTGKPGSATVQVPIGG
jgi:hypothetical protein